MIWIFDSITSDAMSSLKIPALRICASIAPLVIALGWPVAGFAAIHHCIAPDGTSTYSDEPCTSAAQPGTAPPESAAAPTNAQPLTSAPRSALAASGKDAKAEQLLQLLQPTTHALDPVAASNRRAELMAPYLVRQIDPANPSWNSQNPKWNFLLQLVVSDIRSDVQLSHTAADIAQATAREYSAHADEADIDALIQYLHTPQGIRYIEFQGAVNAIYVSALKSLMKQESMPAEPPNDVTLKERRQLLGLSFAVITQVADLGSQSDPSVSAVAPMLVENAAARGGVALDRLSQKYGSDVAGFVAFTESALGRRFFAAYAPALRAGTSATQQVAKNFAALEESKYMNRWRQAYGVAPTSSPPAQAMPVHLGPPKMVPDGAKDPVELAAMQCESKANSEYVRSHKPLPDTDTQYAALISIRDKCRADLKLPPM
jgi:hypothetical protein